MSSFHAVGDDAQLSDPRYLEALSLFDTVQMGEPLEYGVFEAGPLTPRSPRRRCELVER